jgi:hypothetical protein
MLLHKCTSAFAADSKTQRFEQLKKISNQLAQDNILKLEKLLKSQNQKEIIGMELIIAGPSAIRIESTFGHALLRFIDNDPDPYNDVTLAFVADVPTPSTSIFKGVYGSYKVIADVQSFGLFLSLYTYGEGRYLERYPLDLSSEQIQKIGWTIVNSFKSGTDIFSKNLNRSHYSFFKSNCSTLLAAFLSYHLSIQVKSLNWPLAPDLLPRFTQFMGIQSSPAIRILSSYDILSQMAKKLEVKTEDLLHNKWPELPPNFLENWKAHEVTRVFVDVRPKHPNARKAFIQAINYFKEGQQSLIADIAGLKTETYSSCENIKCVENKFLALSQYFSSRSLKRAANQVSQASYYEGRIKSFSREKSTRSEILKIYIKLLNQN